MKALQAGTLWGISLPGGSKQQLLVQYADDTNYTLLSTRDNMVAITRLLELFAQATGLTTNWDKSTAYFFGSGQPPAW
jgi:hypothetical protein